jgi:hypothetical protein
MVLPTSLLNISKYIYIFLLLSILVDIGGGFGIKHTVVILAIVWAGVVVVNSPIYKSCWLELFVCAVLCLNVLYSLYIGIDIADIFSQSSFIIYFALIFVLVKIPRSVLLTIFFKTVTVGSLMIIGTLLAMKLYPQVADRFYQIGITSGLGYFGNRIIGGLSVPVVYYGWSMWLIPALVITWKNNRFASALISVSVLITMSTSVVVFSIFGLMLLYVKPQVRSIASHKKVATTILFCFAILLLGAYTYFDAEILLNQIVSKFSLGSDSTSQKIGHIKGAIDSVSESFMTLMFGTGVGSEFFSPGINKFTINIEPSHFNFLRQYGLLSTIVFFGYIFYVIIDTFRTDEAGRTLSIGLLMLFIAVGTNPLLMSPVFIMVLMITRAYKVRYCKEETNG